MRTSPLGLLVLLALSVSQPGAATTDIPEIGLVLENSSRRNLSDDDTLVINAVTGAFLSSRAFDVAERQRLDKVFEEKTLQGITGGEAQRLGDLAGLDVLGIVSYQVSQERRRDGGTSTEYSITVRLTDVKTGQVLNTIDSKAAGTMSKLISGSKDLDSTTARLLNNIKKKYPPTGYIIKLSGSEAVVDLGSSHGVKKGDSLEVIKQNDTIIHPVTGKEIPGEFVSVGLLKVTSPGEQISTCKVKEGGVNLGDRVRFKGKKFIW